MQKVNKMKNGIDIFVVKLDIAILLLVLVWQYGHCNTATCIGIAI